MSEHPPVGRTPFDLWCTDHLQEGSTVTRSSRGGHAPAAVAAAEFFTADLLSVHFADGSVLHTRPQDWLDQLAAPGAASSVGAGTAGDSTADTPSGGQRGGAAAAAATAATVLLPFELAGAAGATTTRGSRAGGIVPIDRYSFARLTEPSSLDKLYQVGAWLTDRADRWFGSAKTPKAAQLAGKLCRAYESSVLHPALGSRDGLLLRWDGASSSWQPQRAPLAGDQPVLLFLHGTASSTEGSFGALHTPVRQGDKLPTDFAALAAQHTLLAWDHRSLTCSPLANALGLAEALAEVLPPAAAQRTLHLVSQSRGGMVGDLVCLGLGGQVDLACFHRLLRQVYSRDDKHPDAPLVPRLFAALPGIGHLQPGTFVRVASPSRGTLLADRRTDLFLSLLLRSLGLAVGSNGNPLYERLNGLVRGLVAARADARAIPGLEAMIPGSPLTLALNAQAVPDDKGTPLPRLPGRLRVIAGDCAAAGIGGVLTVAADVFYGLHDHDLVVHTHSMFGGFARSDAKSLRLEDKSVQHLGYFKPDALARGPLFAVLGGHDDAFRALADDEAATRGLLQALKPDPLCRRTRSFWDEERRKPGHAQLPIVVLLPGIMGSELFTAADEAGTRPDKPVWLSPAAMLAGWMARLNPEPGPGADRRGRLLAPSLMPVAYEQLLKAVHGRWRVLPWPYDWRASIHTTGLALRAELTRLKDAHPGVPIHLLAHSMGGLVARAALFGPDAEDAFARPAAAPLPSTQASQLWAELKARGSRLLMLGTPNLGAYAPVQLLVQQHALSHLIASAARKVSPQDLARWGGRFDGLMQMLPSQPDAVYGDLCEAVSWASLRADDSLAQLPDDGTLARARHFRAWRDSQFLALQQDPQVLYVAGSGSTPCALRKPLQSGLAGGEGTAGPGAGSVRFAVTPEGDGVVPWLSRLMPERTWYVDCEHGDLADHRDAFGAYFELLETGRTRALPQMAPWRRPARRGGGADEALAAGATAAPPIITGEQHGAPQLPSLPADFSAYVLGVQRNRPRPPAAQPIAVRVVHGGLDYARHPLLVGHYQNDGISGGTKRVDEKLGGQLSRIVDLKLFTGVERTAVYLRPPTDDQLPPAYPGAVVVGLGAVGELTPASLAASVTRAVLRFAFDHLHRDPWVPAEGPVALRLSSLLVGTHVQAITARDSLAAVLAGIWRANQHLLRDPGAGRPMQVVEVELIEIQEQAALDAAYELKRLLERDEWAQRLVWHGGTLESRSGGLRGYRPAHGDAVWQRLVVRQQKLGGLRFELIAERARVEATQVQADLASLAGLLQQLSDAGVRADAAQDGPALGRVLYQLLLPHGLKSRLLNLDNTVLVLDDEAARYPWELMVPPEDDSTLGDGVTPLAVQAGMVRQRVADDFRTLPILPGASEALVVGAPVTSGWRDEAGKELKFSSLPGAEREARNVLQWLAADHRPWRCTALLGAAAPAQRVRLALLERPYRVLHLCGHGVVDLWVANSGDPAQPQAIRKTGMLLGNQQVLSAADIERMGTVPEFVFINCCYSGRDSDASVLSPAQREYPLLASSLALQFIRMGSRAVVAAGWQVDDDDALVFARELYAALLQRNLAFGEAVLQARQAVHGGNRGGNTWGAYQCYGDPDWRFAEQPGQRGFAQQYGSSRLRGAAESMSRSELCDRVLQVVALAGDKPRAALLLQLDELAAALAADPARREWLRHSAVRAAFGQALRELGDHERAVRWLQAGTRNAYSRVALREVEFMVNSLSRIGSRRGHDTALKILDRLEAIDNDDLLYMPIDALPGADTPPAGSTPPSAVSSAKSERDCLRGSARMHLALRAGTRRRRATLYADACARFTTGYAGKLQPRDQADRRAYAMANAMLCAALALLDGATLDQILGHIDALRRHHADAKGWEQHCADLLDEIDALGLSTSFWHYTNTLELISARVLLRLAIRVALDRTLKQRSLEPDEADWLASSQLHCQRKPVEADIAHAQRLLHHALVRWPSPVESESIRQRFEAVRQSCSEIDPVLEEIAPLIAAMAQHAELAVALLRDGGGRTG